MTAAGPLLVAIDAGTGSVRACLVDAAGRVLVSASRPVALLLSGDDRAEVDAEALWVAVASALREALVAVSPGRIAALGITSALGYVLLDAGGAPLGPALLWMDRRAGAEAAELARSLGRERLYRITGRRLDPEILLPKLLWLRRHEPERFSRIRAFVGLKDDLIRRLTGRVGSDPTHAAYSMLYDISRGTWSDEILDTVGLPRHILPHLSPAREIAGGVSPDAAGVTGLPEGLPVVTGASDGTVGCLAAGAVEPGIAVNVAGTTDVVMAASDRPLFDPEGRTLVNVHPTLPGRWMIGGVLGLTGGALAWFADRLCPDLTGPDRFRALDAEAEAAGVGAGGLLCLTGLSGERAPHWNPESRGVLFGLDLSHGRGHIARAILEGAALAVREVVEIMQAAGAGLGRLRVVGGGARSALWNQIRADAIGLPVERPRISEGSVVGAALLAGLASGLYRDLASALSEALPVEETYLPRPAQARAYDRLARRRRALYRAVEGPSA